jgi:hypothetical protein
MTGNALYIQAGSTRTGAGVESLTAIGIESTCIKSLVSLSETLRDEIKVAIEPI